MSVTNISNALLEAVDLIESKGEGAFSAITKVACAHNLTEDQITRVCQTYNRSQQLNTRVAKHSDSVKFAAVGGIVDPTSVINEVQSRRGRLHVSAKTAALEQLQTARSVLMPVDFTTSKVASVTPTQVVPDVDRELGLYHGYSYNQALDLLLDWNGKLGSLQMDCEHLVGSVTSAVSNAVNAVTDLILRSEDRELATKQACLALAGHASDAAYLFASYEQRLLDCLPTYKRADFDPEIQIDVYLPVYHKAASMASDIKAKWNDAVRMLPEKAASCADLRERSLLVRSCLTPSGIKNAGLMLDPKVTLVDVQEEHIAKVASFFSSFIGTRLSGRPGAGDPSASSREQERFKLKIGNPQHEAALLSIRSRAALQQLMVDDPVISAEDPNTVASAFNELAAYTPEAMQTPAVLRSALRQYLMNNTSAADLTAIRGLERPSARPVAA